MSTVTDMQPHMDRKSAQRARAKFVRDAIAADDRSDRYVARQVGVAPSTMSERLSGNTAFHPEDLAVIARILKREPGEFFEAYINAASEQPIGGETHTGESPNLRPKDYKAAVSGELIHGNFGGRLMNRA